MISFPSKNIIKSKGQLLKEAIGKIGELERERSDIRKQLEEAVWQVARLRISLTAVGSHYKLSVDDMKAIIMPFIEKWDAELHAEQLAAIEAQKEKLKADIAAGKMPEFKIIDNTQAKEG